MSTSENQTDSNKDGKKITEKEADGKQREVEKEMQPESKKEKINNKPTENNGNRKKPDAQSTLSLKQSAVVQEVSSISSHLTRAHQSLIIPSDFFLLQKFDSTEISYQERLPKTYKELNLLINKILNNLEETEIVFLNQVKEVVDRDSKIVKHRTKLESLEKAVTLKQNAHSQIDQSVQFIVNLTNDLQNILVKLEKDLSFSPDILNGFKFTPDRMKMYDEIMKMNLKQKEMLQQVSDSITSMNDTISSHPLDPIGQITKILNLHTETLGFVDRKITQIEEEMVEVKTLHDYYISLQNQILSESK